MLRGFLVLALILIALTFLLPFILGFVVILFVAFGVFMLLARLGLLPGATFRTYTYSTRDRTAGSARSPYSRSRSTQGGGDERTIRFDEEAPADNGESGWYQSTQEGEIVTLPETALKKEDEPED